MPLAYQESSGILCACILTYLKYLFVSLPPFYFFAKVSKERGKKMFISFPNVIIRNQQVIIFELGQNRTTSSYIFGDKSQMCQSYDKHNYVIILPLL